MILQDRWVVDLTETLNKKGKTVIKKEQIEATIEKIKEDLDQYTRNVNYYTNQAAVTGECLAKALREKAKCEILIKAHQKSLDDHEYQAEEEDEDDE